MATFAILRRAHRPVLLDGLLEDWPRRGDLTLARLRERFADRRVPTMLTNSGMVKWDIDRGLALGTVRFGDYLDRVTSGEAVDSYLVSPLDSASRTEVELSEEQEAWLEWMTSHQVQHIRIG